MDVKCQVLPQITRLGHQTTWDVFPPPEIESVQDRTTVLFIPATRALTTHTLTQDNLDFKKHIGDMMQTCSYSLRNIKICVWHSTRPRCSSRPQYSAILITAIPPRRPTSLCHMPSADGPEYSRLPNLQATQELIHNCPAEIAPLAASRLKDQAPIPDTCLWCSQQEPPTFRASAGSQDALLQASLQPTFFFTLRHQKQHLTDPLFLWNLQLCPFPALSLCDFVVIQYGTKVHSQVVEVALKIGLCFFCCTFLGTIRIETSFQGSYCNQDGIGPIQVWTGTEKNILNVA